MCSTQPYKQLHIDLVGQFWRPHRISARAFDRRFKRAIKLFAEKPRMRVFDNPEYGMTMALWLLKPPQTQAGEGNG